jgi:putative transposase
MDKFQNKYRIPSARLKGYDYGSNGMYFVTICTQNRLHYFGEIVSTSLRPTVIGQIAIDFWNEIPKHFPFVELDEFIIMPNHIHGILFFNKPNKTDWTPNQFGAQSKNLGSVIRGFKASVKRHATKVILNLNGRHGIMTESFVMEEN